MKETHCIFNLYKPSGKWYTTIEMKINCESFDYHDALAHLYAQHPYSNNYNIAFELTNPISGAVCSRLVLNNVED